MRSFFDGRLEDAIAAASPSASDPDSSSPPHTFTEHVSSQLVYCTTLVEGQRSISLSSRGRTVSSRPPERTFWRAWGDANRHRRSTLNLPASRTARMKEALLLEVRTHLQVSLNRSHKAEPKVWVLALAERASAALRGVVGGFPLRVPEERAQTSAMCVEPA